MKPIFGNEFLIHQDYVETYLARAEKNNKTFSESYEVHKLYAILLELQKIIKLKIV